MPKPTIPGVAPELKRSLAELGDRGAALGPGEIALVADERSTGFLHVGGELQKVIPLDVWPSIHIAVEAPELIAELEYGTPLDNVLHQLRALKLDSVVERPQIPHAQEVAIRLTRTLLAEVSFGPGPTKPGAQHLDGPAVGRLAASTGAARALLTHLQMGNDPDETIASCRAVYDGPVEMVWPESEAEI